MNPNRYVPGHSSVRKSRHDSKVSLLPVPRRVGSTDRNSTDARRPSSSGVRSSSAEPVRATFGAPRMSREASATKLTTNRSRSQTTDQRWLTASTPIRSSQPGHSRPTTTPLRTPEDRNGRSWQTCLERALAYVTTKDQRPISNPAWQRTEYARVCAALGDLGSALVRPLTIARFVDIVKRLLSAIYGDSALTTDNYVTKLPHTTKRALYPGTVAKSWLRTVNTLHAFPQALALIGYLLDLATHCQMPVSEEWLYVGKDDLARLRQEYFRKCWIRFQESDAQFEDLNKEYVQELRKVLGADDNDAKIKELEHTVKEYESQLDDEEEQAARAEEARRVEKRDALLAALRAQRAARRDLAAKLQAGRVALRERAEQMRALDADIQRGTEENARLREELAAQAMTVEERTRLLDEVDYATRVHDSKTELAQQISKMLVNKENELAQWQKMTLDSCVAYKQGLIHLSARLPALAALGIDEKELMESESVTHMTAAVETLRGEVSRLSARKAELMRTRSALSRKRAELLEQTRAKIKELKLSMDRDQQALRAELGKEEAEAAAWSSEQAEVNQRLEQLRANQEQYARVDAELDFWRKQDLAWRAKLAAMHNYIEKQREHVAHSLAAARQHRARALRRTLAAWSAKLDTL